MADNIQRVEWSKIDAFYPLQNYAEQSVICVIILTICLLQPLKPNDEAIQTFPKHNMKEEWRK